MTTSRCLRRTLLMLGVSTAITLGTLGSAAAQAWLRTALLVAFPPITLFLIYN